MTKMEAVLAAWNGTEAIMPERGRRPLMGDDQTSILPPREWDRGTELVKLFLATGYIENCRPQSLLLAGEPGSGKTELLDRFRVNRSCSYHSDLTVRQLMPILRQVQRGVITHLVLTEFQKLMMRKQSVADNLLGTLVQAMEEGVGSVSVGPNTTDYSNTRIAVIGAITNGTVAKRKEYLAEMGFLSRCATIEWDMPPEEEKQIMDRVTEGDYSDLEPVHLARPAERVHVELSKPVGELINDYVWRSRKGKAMRHHNRLRALAQASALLDNRDEVNERDVEWVRGFDVYWHRLVE